MTKSRSNAVAPNAKGTLVVGNGTDASTTLAVASTAGYLLSVDSAEATGLKWAAPATGGGVTLIATTTPSGVSVINYTSISGYKHLLLTWNGVYTSDHDTAFNVRFNNDSSGIYSVNDISGQTWAGGQYALFMEGNSLNENSGHGYLYIYDVASTAYWKTFNGQSAYYDGNFGWKGANDARGMWRSTSAITSVDIVRTAGSGTLSVVSGGVVKLWGLSQEINMKLVIDLENNTETLVELSEADIAQQQIDQIAHDTPREITCPFELERLAKKAAAEAKLAALGLTSDDLKALGL